MHYLTSLQNATVEGPGPVYALLDMSRVTTSMLKTCYGPAAVMNYDGTLQDPQSGFGSGALLLARGRACRGLARLLKLPGKRTWKT